MHIFISTTIMCCLNIFVSLPVENCVLGTSVWRGKCTEEIDWENAKIIGREKRWTQRKYLEGIETLRQKNKGITPLNNYNRLEQWQSVLYPFFEKT